MDPSVILYILNLLGVCKYKIYNMTPVSLTPAFRVLGVWQNSLVIHKLPFRRFGVLKRLFCHRRIYLFYFIYYYLVREDEIVSVYVGI